MLRFFNLFLPVPTPSHTHRRISRIFSRLQQSSLISQMIKLPSVEISKRQSLLVHSEHVWDDAEDTASELLRTVRLSCSCSAFRSRTLDLSSLNAYVSHLQMLMSLPSSQPGQSTPFAKHILDSNTIPSTSTLAPLLLLVSPAVESLQPVERSLLEKSGMRSPSSDHLDIMLSRIRVWGFVFITTWRWR